MIRLNHHVPPPSFAPRGPSAPRLLLRRALRAPAALGSTLALLGSLLATSAFAQTFFYATLDGLQETPPNASLGTGVACMYLDTAGFLHYMMTYGGLGAAETMTHIHEAPPGLPGPILFNISPSPPGPSPLGSPKVGFVGPLNAAQIGSLTAGNLYWNVHTGPFPGGEIRGQILAGLGPCERDYFPSSEADLEIETALPLPPAVETIHMTGPTDVLAGIRNLNDHDFDGREQIPTEMLSLTLTGTSVNLGQMRVTVRSVGADPNRISSGEIEETVNAVGGRLDLPPFALSGNADSFFDVFFEVELLNPPPPFVPGTKLHNHVPKHPSGVISRKPPRDNETYTDVVPVNLFDALDNPVPVRVRRIVHLPNPPERDPFPSSRAIVTVSTNFPLPALTTTVVMQGPSQADVDMGLVMDTDAVPDGLEQVPTELVQLSLTGADPVLGTMIVRLPQAAHPALKTRGEIEETANLQNGRLDLPPFAAAGTAESFFDVFFEVELVNPPPPLVAGTVLHNHVPKHMEGLIRHKPPIPGDNYESPAVIQLFDQFENPAPVQIGFVRHAPDPVERDHFANSHAAVDIENTLDGSIHTVSLYGPTDVDVQMWALRDIEPDGLEQVPTEMVSMSLTGIDPVLGNMVVRVPQSAHPGQKTIGEIEENGNAMAGRLDIRPFDPAPGTTATSFFDVFFEVELTDLPLADPNRILHNHAAKHLQTVISYKPPAPGETYQDLFVIPLFNTLDALTPYRLRRTRHTPNTEGGAGVEPGVVPQRLAIQEIRPNPLRNSTTITYGLPQRATVDLVIYDVTGRAVRTLVHRVVEAGSHSVTWDSRNDKGKAVAAGVYFTKLESVGLVSVRRLVVLR